MRKFLLIALLFFSFCSTNAQLLSWTPTFPTESTATFTITMDATKGNKGLLNYATTSDVYVHTGVITSASTSNSDWRYVKFNQVFTTTNPSLQATYVGANRWQFTISGGLRTYYGVPAGETILKIAILFRSGNGTLVQRNIDASDMYIPVSTTALDTRITNPFKQPTYIPKAEPITKVVGNTIALSGASNTAATLKLYFNGALIQTATAATTITATTAPTITASGTQTIILEASVGTTFKYDTIKFYVPGTITVAALPAGVRDGINYESDSTAVTFVLYAPGKTRVSIIGDIPGSNWDEVAAYQMKKTPDGNYWWLRVTGLTPGFEYSFQYLINGNLPVSDPYVEKVLDPWNDRYITSNTFPGLKAYPTGYTIGIVGTFQTKSPSYSWTTASYVRPDKKKMVVYELLLRDFIANHDWKTLKDSINYFKNLGINAIQLMPINEFEGNNSWGYNPDFYFAPDKYYGPKNDLKQFIDICHANGIAVIMDIALNHSFGLSPMVQMYWDSVNNRPAANNPWFNSFAKHGFSVGYDFNHESLATRYFTSRVLEHWLVNYKIDGFRFDLSKGFTQTQTCDNTGNNCSVGTWSAYDASRIAIWKRYYDTMQLKAPGSIPILEHFADNSEEIELSNYGFLLWGNMNSNFSQTTMGYVSGSDLSYTLHINRGWSNPHLVGYMESHDEERVNFKNISYGNVYNGYNIKDTNVAPKRMELAYALMLSMPGPKMIWQFGELGYDSSINFCQNSTISTTCRTDPKPIKWGYFQDPERKALYTLIGNMNKLRNNAIFAPVFTFGNIGYNLSGLIKTISVTQGGASIITMANMDVAAQTATITFPSAGTWYNYLSGGTFTSTGTGQTFTLNPGEYRVYTNQLVSLCNLSMVLNNGVDTISSCASPYVLTAPSGYSAYSWNTGATTASINVTTTGWYRCTVTQASCTATDSVFVKIATAVPTPTSIISRTGNFNPCINDTITYRVVSPVPTNTQISPTKFRWTRPVGTTVLLTNADSSQIQIRYDATFVGGTLSVAGVSACGLAGTGFSTTLRYGVPTPTAITARTGNFTPCINDTITYTVTSPAASASQTTPTKFRWTRPVGTTVLLTNADSSQIRIRYDATFVGGTLSVAGVSACGLAGTGFSTTLRYGVPTPTAITARTGNFTPCINDTITYTVTSPAASASQTTPTKFRWTRPVGTTVLLTNADSSQIRIRYDATFVGGTLSVAGVSACGLAGTGFSTTLRYGVPTPTAITARTGTFTPCINDTITYTVTSPAASASQTTPTKFRWTRPVGTTVLLTNADSSQIRIRYDATFVGGTLSVAGVSACGLAGTGFSTTLRYGVPTPTAITARTGNFTPCINDTITYTVTSPAASASQTTPTKFRWTRPVGTTVLLTNADSSQIRIRYDATFVGGTLSVAGVSACGLAGTGFSTTLRYGVPTPTAITARTGNFTPCINDTITYTVTSPAASASQTTPTKFRWTRPVGTTVLLTNADSSQIRIRYDATFVGGTLSVAGVSACGLAGTGFSTTLRYGVPTPTAITARTGTFTPCINDTITYTVTSPAASASQTTPTKFRWTRPVGTTVLLTNADSSQIRIRYDATFVGGTLSVAGVSACGLAGTGFSTTLRYGVPTPTAITARTGNFTPCINDTITYTVTSPAASASQTTPTKFRWTRPVGTTVLLTNADSSQIRIRYDATFVGGTLSVAGVSACGLAGTAFTTTLAYLPPTPTNITSRTGAYNACINDTITYTVVVPAPIAGQRAASVYRWTIPAATAIQSATADSSSIKLKFNTGYVGGNLTVRGQTACGTTAQGTVYTKALTHTGCPAGTKLPITLQQIEKAENPQAIIWPNPSHQAFSLKVNGYQKSTTIKVIITDMQGRVIKQTTARPGEIKTLGAGLSSGVYMVQLSADNYLENIRIVKD